MRFHLCLWSLAFFSLQCLAASIALANEVPIPDERPNVLIFLIDDLGRSDIGVDGSTLHETPHLDALAKAGVRFTDFYSAHPVCSPTRAALMTGKVPQRLGITDWIHPGSEIALPAEEITLGEVFQKNGYQTAYVGKWHLGEDDANTPMKHGFEWTKGVNRAGQPGSYYFPYRRPNSSPSVYDVPDFENVGKDEYLTDVLTTGAIEFLEKRDQKRPFLLCFGHYSVHTPIQPPVDLPEKYRRKIQQRYGDSPMPTISAPNNSMSRGRQDEPNYAAMVENLDKNIGRVIASLTDSGLMNNTIIVFTSDNGGLCTMGNKKTGPTCNLPWRSGKGWTYEGGIRIPTWISWPNRLKPLTCNTPGYTADIYPTLLELCGFPALPEQHIDGRSLVSALLGNSDPAMNERTLAWYYPHDHGSGHQPSAAIRKGSLKLIYKLNSGESELYDLANDPSESADLSSSHPEKKQSLTAELLQWIESTKVSSVSKKE